MSGGSKVGSKLVLRDFDRESTTGKGQVKRGGDEGTRTLNPRLAKAVRYQLRHVPELRAPTYRRPRCASTVRSDRTDGGDVVSYPTGPALPPAGEVGRLPPVEVASCQRSASLEAAAFLRKASRPPTAAATSSSFFMANSTPLGTNLRRGQAPPGQGIDGDSVRVVRVDPGRRCGPGRT